MQPFDFFCSPQTIAQKQYEALRMVFVERKTITEAAQKFGYTYRGLTTIISNFRKELKSGNSKVLYFKELKHGRKEIGQESKDVIISLRKKYYSVEDIKVALDSKGFKISEKSIYNIIRQQGFARLPRRQKLTKKSLVPTGLKADKTVPLTFIPESFKSASAGILCLLPYIKKYGIDQIIEASGFPGTSQISKQSSILSFIAIKSSNARRYTADDLWCMDRGLGLFAGLNVLPKAAWFTSYSHRVTREMNLKFLKLLHLKWKELGLLGDTSNLDFTTIPYWGDNDHLENNWSGKRGKALASMLAVLAQDPDSGIIDYGDTNVMHKDESAVVLEFIDFYGKDGTDRGPKYLAFDSKFTNYQNLGKLDDDGIKFITIRRRGKNIVDRLNALPQKNWKTIRIQRAGNKKATIKVLDENISLKGYDKQIRQISITGHGKIKPATIISNDFDLTTEQVIRKYARRWIVEKSISEQIEFFHLNSVSSSMVIKVDFDLTMSIVTHNLFRLFASDTDRYQHKADQAVYEQFLDDAGDIIIDENIIRIELKKKRTLPLILEKMNNFKELKYEWLNNFELNFTGASYS
ncbi:MAG: transposase [Bacteroidales bacterium]|nr:transposase [Bacteroidales bacterium]